MPAVGSAGGGVDKHAVDASAIADTSTRRTGITRLSRQFRYHAIGVITRAFITYGIVAVFVASSVPARADDADDARAAATQAVEQAAAGNFDAAIELFRKARSLDDRPEYVCNIGTAYYRAGKYPEAHAYFSLCLGRKGTVSAGHIDVVQQAFTYIDQKLRQGDYAAVDVSVLPKGALVRPDYLPEGDELPGSRAFWFSFGKHSLAVSAPGHDPKTITFEAKDRQQRLEVKLTETQISEPVEPNDPSAPVTGRPQIAKPSDAAPSRRPAWIALAAGGVLVVGGGVMHVVALNTKGELEGMTADERVTDPSTLDAFETQRAITIGLYAAGAVAVGVGAYLWWRAPRQSNVDVQVGSDSAGGSAVLVRWSGTTTLW